MEARKQEIKNQIKFLKEEFISRMEVQMAQAEMIQNSRLKRFRQAQLAKSLEDFADWHSRLVDRVEKIISEGV